MNMLMGAINVQIVMSFFFYVFKKTVIVICTCKFDSSFNENKYNNLRPLVINASLHSFLIQ